MSDNYNPNNGYNPDCNNPNYNPNYNPQQELQTNYEQSQNFPQNTQFVPQPNDPFVQQPTQSQEQAWYNQSETPTPQEQNWYNQPQQDNAENIVQDLEQIYLARQFKPNAANTKTKKPKKHKKRKKLTFSTIILLLLIFAIGFFTAQYLINESFLDKTLPDEPFQYTASSDYREYITSNIILPDILGDENSTYEVIWESSHPDILNSEGVVNRPENKNQTVTLTMKLKRGFWYSQRKFDVVVIKSAEKNPDDIFVITNDMVEEGISANEFTITYKEDGSIHSIDGNFNNTLVESETDALAIIDAYREFLNISNDLSFELDNVQTSLIGKTYFFVPTKNDIKVAGQGVTISTKNNYLSNITTNITSVSYDTGNELTDEELIKIANEHLSVTAGLLDSEIFIFENKIVYKIVVFEEGGNGELVALTIDAATKEVLSKEEIVLGYNNITGTGVDETGKKQTFPVVEEKTLLATKYKLMDTARNIVIVDGNDYTWKKVSNGTSFEAISKSKNKWDDYPVGISAMINFAKTYDWYKEKFGYISFDGKGKTIYCFVNAHEILDSMYDNAAYVPYGAKVFFGGEERNILRYAAIAKLEVTAHEFTHGVYSYIAGHSFNDKVMAESIDEGYADIFGCLIEGNWTIGEGLMVNYDANRDPSGTVTNLPKKYPSKYLDENWDYFDGHANSVVLSRAAYQMTQQGFSEDDVARIWFQSMFYGYYNGDDFLTVRSHVEQAAKALGYSDEQLVIIGDIFGNLGIGEMATRIIESYAVEGDRLKDNTTEKTYIVALSPLGTVLANTPIWIFEEDTNVSTTATDAEMSAFLSNYATNYLNSMSDDWDWNISVDYRKYSPWAMNIIGRYMDDAKQGLLGDITSASGMEEKDANILLSMAFLTFKFEGTAYEFFSEILELDYSRLIIEEDGNISYDFTQ